MRVFVLLALSFCLASVGHGAEKQDVADLIGANRRALQFTQADSSQLDQVINHLEAALKILENGKGSNDQNACLAYAVDRYKEAGYTPAQGMDRAVPVCKSIKDLELAKFAAEKYKEAGYTGAQAIERAALLATEEMKGKLDLVKFAFGKYLASGYSAAQSVERAASLAKSLNKDNLDCVKMATSNYEASGYTGAQSIERAVSTCK